MTDHLAYSGTFSRDPLAYGLGQGTRVVKMDGCRVLLSEHDEWLVDWCSGLGSSLLGYNQPDVDAEATPYARGNPSISHHLEPEVAKLLAYKVGGNIPGWGPEDVQVRFGLSGSDAVTMAVTLARAATGKPGVVVFRGGYHGWHQWTIGRVKPAHGIRRDPDVVEVPSYDPKYFDDFWLGAEVACVVFEHPSFDLPQEFYAGLLNFCASRKSLLIMDEVVTGIRYGLGGASARYNLAPDLVCMGKSLGNGWPVSAVLGRRDLMGWFARIDPVFCSSTYWGWPGGLAAVRSVLNQWSAWVTEDLWGRGELVADALALLDPKGHPVRQYFNMDHPDHLAWFLHRMRQKGHLLNTRPILVNLAHGDEEIEGLKKATEETMGEMLALFDQGGQLDLEGVGRPRVLFEDR